MKTSTHGLTLIEQREGIRLTGYKDSEGLPTVGVGHLIKPGEPYRVGKKITQEECDRLFADDIKTYENAVNSAVKVPLSQNQFDALVSVSLNIGVQGFKNSTIVRRLNAKNYKGAAEAIMFWNKPPEIKGRRRTEQKQFLTPGPIPATTAANDGSPSLPTPSNTEDQSDPISTLTADTANPDTAPDLSGNGGDAPPITQTAETIVNTGDIPAPAVATEEVTLVAPPSTGAVAASTKMTIAGIAVPSCLVAVFKAISNLVTDGYIDAKDIGNTVLSFITNNTKYVLALVGLVIVLVIIKRVTMRITLWLSMLTHAIPSWNSITVVPVEPQAVKKWWRLW